MADFADEELETQALDVEPEAASTVTTASHESAQGQSTELSGHSGGSQAAAAQSEEAKKAAEAERVAIAARSWEQLLGQKFGAKLFELVRQNVSYGDLLGYAKQASEAMAGKIKGGPLKPTAKGALGGAMDEASEAAAVNKLLAALAPAIQAQVDKWIESETAQHLLTAVSQWVEEHPKTVLASVGVALVGAAVAAYVSNMDPAEFKQSFKIGERIKAGVAIDVGPLQKLAIQAASASIQYDGAGMKAKVEVRRDVEKGTTTGSASLSGGGKIGKKTTAHGAADVSLADTGRVKIHIKGDLSSVIGHTPLSMSAGASRAQGGGGADSTQINGQIQLGDKGQESTVKGSFDPGTKAFDFSLSRTFMDGATSVGHSTGRDASGKMTSTDSMRYDAGEGRSMSLSDTRGGGGHTTSASLSQKDVGGSGVDLSASGSMGAKKSLAIGAGFDIGKFRNQLDYEMSQGVQTLGIRSSANLDDELSIGLQASYDLSNARMTEMGAKLGWKDTDQWRSFMLEYKGRWLQDNPGYEHGFDAAFEYATGNLSGRVRAGVKLKGGGVSKASASALMGYKLNPDWAILGGLKYDATRGAGGRMDQTITPEIGVQYKSGVALTVGFQKGRHDGAITVGIKIPLGW